MSKGKLVTIDNYYELFKDILNPKQLEGLRLLVTPMSQQQFNATADRRSLRPSRGVTCFDCHVNGHTNGATHLVGDIRPQELRHRLDVPSLRGVYVMRVFGSQRSLKSIEDFTEFEQRAAYFDGDPTAAQAKGVTILERGSQVHFMAEFQDLMDFPPAPKLTILGKLHPKKASDQELRGEGLFNGKAQCCGVPSGAVLHGQLVAQPAHGTLLQGANGPGPQGFGGRAHQDLHAARHQGLAAVSARRPTADLGRYR